MNNGATGGQSGTSSPTQSAYSYISGTIPDEYQIQVMRELGTDDAHVQKMLKDGMGVVDYAHVVPAADMLKAMETRYGIGFRADWVNVGAQWSLGCTAEDGPCAGDSFTIEAYEQADGSIAFFDDYYGAHRSAEYEAFGSDLVREALDEEGIHAPVAVQATLSQTVSQSVEIDAPFADGANDFYGHCSIVFFGKSGPSETEGTKLASKLVKTFKDKGARAAFDLAYYPNCTDEADALANLTVAEPSWYVLKAM